MNAFAPRAFAPATAMALTSACAVCWQIDLHFSYPSPGSRGQVGWGFKQLFSPMNTSKSLEMRKQRTFFLAQLILRFYNAVQKTCATDAKIVVWVLTSKTNGLYFYNG
jgi:hypothetical protein